MISKLNNNNHYKLTITLKIIKVICNKLNHTMKWLLIFGILSSLLLMVDRWFSPQNMQPDSSSDCYLSNLTVSNAVTIVWSVWVNTDYIYTLSFTAPTDA